MNVLVIEDDNDIAAVIEIALLGAGHEIKLCDDGATGLELALDDDFDLLVVDRKLPVLDGLSLIKTLRARGNTTPVMFLSALGEVNDRVEGLRAGADDYLAKPFAMDELLARIEAHGRRRESEGVTSTPTRLFTADLEMDLIARTVVRGDEKIDLQAREFRLLEYLLRHKGKTLTRAMLLKNVWDYHFDPQTNIIDVHISRLRQKLGETHKTPLLKTVRGVGYVLEDLPVPPTN